MKKIASVIAAVALCVGLSSGPAEAAESPYWARISPDAFHQNFLSGHFATAKAMMKAEMTPRNDVPVTSQWTRDLSQVCSRYTESNTGGLYVPPGAIDSCLKTNNRGVFLDDDLLTQTQNDNRFVNLVAVHELSHWFATPGFKEGAKWDAILTAIRATDAFAHWKNVALNNPDPAVRAEYTYLKNADEMFARAVSQWLAQKNYGSSWYVNITATYRFYVDGYWTDADFASVASVLNAQFS